MVVGDDWVLLLGADCLRVHIVVVAQIKRCVAGAGSRSLLAKSHAHVSELLDALLLCFVSYSTGGRSLGCDAVLLELVSYIIFPTYYYGAGLDGGGR